MARRKENVGGYWANAPGTHTGARGMDEVVRPTFDNPQGRFLMQKINRQEFITLCKNADALTSFEQATGVLGQLNILVDKINRWHANHGKVAKKTELEYEGWLRTEIEVARRKINGWMNEIMVE